MAQPLENPFAPSAVTDAVRRFFLRRPADASRLLVALSGGPDSVALLEGLRAEAEARGATVFACWVDHALRPPEELAAEEAFVRGLCSELGVPLSVERAARGEIERSARSEGGVEAAARRFRYAALERARVAASCDLVLTGHNADDFVETMIMRFCAGAGTAGLRGIPAAIGRIRRPLIDVTKADILAYLDALGREYRTDSTNASNDYLRNKVRHEVLPTLLDVFPSLRESLTTVAAKARLDDGALAAEAESLLVDSGRLPEGVRARHAEARCIEASAFYRAPLAVRTRALYLLCGPVAHERMPWRLVSAAAESDRESGRLASGAGIEFVKEDGFLFARRADGSHGSRTVAEDEASAAYPGFSFLAPSAGEYRIGKALACRIYYSESPPGIRADAFSWPVWVRSRRHGDALRSGGGRKMVDSMLSELGIALPLRRAVPIVEDAEGIVAVLAASSGGRDLYRRNDGLGNVPATGFFVFDLKGAALTDAVRR